MMIMIDLDELRLLLRLNEIDDSKYTDKDLEHLIDYYTKVFNSLICFNYHIKRYDDFYPADGSFDSLLLNHYPVTKLITLKIDNKDCANFIREFNKKSGIIYFNKHFIGDVKVTYRSGWSQEDIDTYIIPLIIDLIIYSIKYGGDGVVSSVTEGDVSVSFDMNSSSIDINQRIKDLNRRFCPKARML